MTERSPQADVPPPAAAAVAAGASTAETPSSSDARVTPLRISPAAQLQRRLGGARRVLAGLDRRLAREAHHKPSLAARAVLRRDAGDAPGAIDDLHALVRLEPGNAAAWLALGQLLDDAEQWHAAAKCLLRATAVDPRLAPAWLALARVLIRLQRPDDALGALDRLTRLGSVR